MIQEKYPFCKGKTAYLHNGVEKAEFDYRRDVREKGRIIAVGGDRKLKNNVVVASAVAKLDSSKKLIVYDGGYVAACLFRNGEFFFDITNKKDELIRFAGSKYVKSNPVGIYDKVVEKLKNGKKVLFIGLPCQVAAIKNYTITMPAGIGENLYTVDLICHGTPSPKILSLALREKGINIKQLRDIRFRNKTNFGLSSQNGDNGYKTITPMGVQDMYTYAYCCKYSVSMQMD